MLNQANKQFAGFLLVGVTSSVISIITRYLANFVFSFEWAVAISHITGMLVNFVLSKFYIFPESNQHASVELLKFSVVNIASLMITTGVSSYAYRVVLPYFNYQFYPALSAHIIGLAACTIPSYFGHKYFSFSGKK